MIAAATAALVRMLSCSRYCLFGLVEADQMVSVTSKKEKRRIELADHAVRCFAERGYGGTSLRDIALAAAMNLGRLHYDFVNKADLVTLAVRRYKLGYVANLREMYDSASVSRRGIKALVGKWAANLTEDAEVHRLWYDLRTQAMFVDDLREVTAEIQQDLEHASADFLRKINGDLSPAEVHRHYLLMDALFFDALRWFLMGDRKAVALFRRDMEDLLLRIARIVV